MGNDNKTSTRLLTSKDIAVMVGIGDSTVRKYAAALEDAGYPFTKDGEGEKAARIFTDTDAMVIRHLKDLREKSQIPVEQAAMVIANKHSKFGQSDEDAIPTPHSVATINAINERFDKRYDDIEAKVDALIEMNRSLAVALDERDNAIRQLTEIVTAQKQITAGAESERERRERERDERLTQVLSEIREMKEAANRSLWKRLFGK